LKHYERAFCIKQQNLFLKGRIDTYKLEHQSTDFKNLFLFLRGRIDTFSSTPKRNAHISCFYSLEVG
ncbi:hypothetical protein HWHPT5561_09940, partial [Petrotoga sp. HWH.PT.55.6.1]